MRRIVFALISAVFSVLQPAAAQSTKAAEIGIVLMHGKWGQPGGLSKVATELRAAGAIVEVPKMPWSRDRRYATSYDGAMAEIDAAVARLKANGAKRILVGGQSMGANAALGYGARREGLAGVFLLAPGHVPGIPGFDKRLAQSVARARDLVASGKGATKATFKDTNQGRDENVTATASDYLSWFDPTGPAVMKTNASRLKPGTPIFCADGTKEKNPRCPYVLGNLPRQVKRAHVSVNADHRGVSEAAVRELVEWMREL